MFNLDILGYFNSSLVKPLSYTKEPYTTMNVYQLEFCTAGNGSYMINNKNYTRHYGTVMFVRPNEPISCFYKVDHYECYTIHFTCNDIPFIKRYLNKLPSQIFLRNTSEIEKKFKHIIFPQLLEQLTDSKNMTEMKNELLCSELKSLIINLYFETLLESPQATSMYKENIENVKKYISKNFRKDISAKDMAQVAHLSEGFTYKQFKKITGKTPHEYLLDIRLNYACSQLILTNDSISEISLNSGFKKPNYLNTVFKKIKGVTPLQYRKDNQIQM